MPCFAHTLPDRFWKKVSKRGPDECWLWTAATLSPAPYGLIATPNGIELAHRVSYQLHYGTIPKGLCVTHICDNPSCVNPKHLYLGNHRTNALEMIIRGRNVGGENQPHWGRQKPRHKRRPRQILSDEQVVAILADPRSSLKVAPEYGVAAAYIRRLRTGNAPRGLRPPA